MKNTAYKPFELNPEIQAEVQRTISAAPRFLDGKLTQEEAKTLNLEALAFGLMTAVNLVEHYPQVKNQGYNPQEEKKKILSAIRNYNLNMKGYMESLAQNGTGSMRCSRDSIKQ